MTSSRPALLARLAAATAQRAEADLLRRLRAIAQRDGTRIVVDGRRLLSFASNDYLGLSQHPALRDALCLAAHQHGVGAGAAHLLGGHRDEHMALEGALAHWTGRSAALLFSTGYMANLGVLSTLLGADDSCVQDKLNHASLLDGARLAGCELRRYVHNDVDSARQQLRVRPDAAALLAVDGVFSMDGDVAPLPALAALCREEGATLMVDDAHGLGVLGDEGRGSIATAALGEGDVPVLMGTLGKALGTFGAFVAGPRALIDGLIQFARPFVYTTAMPAAIAAATLVAIDIARHEAWRRDKLRVLVRHFRAGAAVRGLALADSPTPIQPVIVGESATALHVARALDEAGFYVPAVRSPTVPANAARLRVTLSALHTEGEVEQLLDALSLALRKARDATTSASPAPRHEPRRPARPASRRTRPR